MAIHRRIFGLWNACIAVFIYFFILNFYDYVTSVQANNFIDYDVKTITAGDYSIEFDLDSAAYDRWQAHYYDETNPMSENAQFKLYVQSELEDRINELPDMGLDPEDERDERKKIAQITFAYANNKLVNMLIKRGKCIAKEKWDKLAKINDEIEKALKTEDEKDPANSFLQKLQRPVSVFATFESEEGHARACNYNEVLNAKFLGQDIEL